MNQSLPKKIVSLVVLFWLLITLPFVATAKKQVPTGSLYKVSSKLHKHFDSNDDGFLDRLEYEQFKTYLYFGYPLAQTVAEQAYDNNKNGMIEPGEYYRYQQDKRSGRDKVVIKKFKKNSKKKTAKKIKLVF